MTDEKQRGDYIGMPWDPKLDLFGRVVFNGFDSHPYLVGSATERRDWRDVDVRLVLFDDEFARLFGEETDHRSNPALAVVNMAFSALGKDLTGLPIDFQIEQMTAANAEHSGGRNALGLGSVARPAP